MNSRGPAKCSLFVFVVAEHVADVLTQEALDALVELLTPLDVDLLHPMCAIGFRAAWD